MQQRIFKNKTKILWWWVTGFYNKKYPKGDSNHTCLAVISLDFVLKKDESYYPQIFLKEYKYIKKSN